MAVLHCTAVKEHTIVQQLPGYSVFLYIVEKLPHVIKFRFIEKGSSILYS
ncbi:hypothetical protein ACFPFV_03270 [Salinicoccus siamensis]